jgi:hypothetical protein
MASMRAAIAMFILNTVTFSAAFVTRRMFLWDVRPVSWDYDPPQNGALELAYLLLSIENMAAIVGVYRAGVRIYSLAPAPTTRYSPFVIAGLGLAVGPKIRHLRTFFVIEFGSRPARLNSMK